MKIVFTCHYSFDPNAGAAGVTWRLGEAYRKAGHEVEYYSFDDVPQSLRRLKVALFPEFVAHYLLRSHQRHSIDVIDASTGDAWLWGFALQRFQRKRPLLVARCHGLEHLEHLEYLEESRRGNLKLSWKYPLYRGSIRLWEAGTSMRCADLALFLNRRDRAFAIDHLGVPRDRAHVIANGIPDALLNLPLEPTPSESEPIRIAQVSSYIIRKGIQYGSPALNAILHRHPTVELSLLGTERPAEEVYADFDPSLHSRIKVVPYYENAQLPMLLKGHHIKVLPTIAEGFGVALLEAMACGLAPVTTDAPGPSEIVQNGKTGLIVPCRDRTQFEQAIERLLSDRPFLDRLRQNAHAHAQRFSWSKLSHSTLALYQSVPSTRQC